MAPYADVRLVPEGHGASAAVRGRPQPWFHRNGLRLAEMQAAVAEEWRLAPPLPPEWHADTAQAALTKFGKQVLARCSPAGTPAPKQDWLTADS